MSHTRAMANFGKNYKGYKGARDYLAELHPKSRIFRC